MLFKFFKGTGPGVIFMTGITMLSVWMGALFKIHGHLIRSFDLNPMPLYGLLASMAGKYPLAGVVFSFLLVLLMVLMIVNLNNSLFFIHKRTFLPALIYILISGLFPDYQIMNPALFSALFLMLAIRRIMDSYKLPYVSYSFFDAGLLISTGSLFYANIIWFGIMIIIGIALMRMSNIKEILIALIGLITPYALTFGIYYVIGKNPGDLLSVIRYNLFIKQTEYVFSRLIIAAIVVIGLITVVSVVNLLMEMNKKKVQSRKIFSFLIWFFIISLTVYFLFSSVSVEMLCITAIPLSYFIAHYLLFSKRDLISEIVLTMLFLMIFIVQVVNFR
jgi:hypothetical protein